MILRDDSLCVFAKHHMYLKLDLSAPPGFAPFQDHLLYASCQYFPGKS